MVILMNKNASILMITLLLAALLAVGGCRTNSVQQPGLNETLFNQSLNNELEQAISSGNSTSSGSSFVPFKINFTKNPNVKYDFAADDVFAIAGENFTSLDAAVFGVMLGDSYEDVLLQLGVPDVMFVPADKSYRNMEYGKKIGVSDKVTAISFHLQNDVVDRISMRQTFKPYLVGNTSIGQEKEYLYAVFNVPDYFSFTEFQKVHHYVEKGIELYINRDKIEIISILPPKEFKGVIYKSVPVEIAPGVYANVTKPFPIE
jgi:hypothetical protein